MQIDIDSNDCDYPYTTKSTIYASLWNSMLHQSTRELKYEASLAGINAGIKIHSGIHLEHWSYNDKIESYFKEVFQLVQTFSTDENYFNNLVDKFQRSLKN